ncbi:glycine--tRNA ligase, chloroplastic/mitochondrial 2-like [Morus notabilis]|uniref:glycine--tRNA ligase, chloroplastic/mitochondrial 2-like n=1 Tax=Morus notabilis TaxID=981085 RepID=UPI000CED5C60|nr:glycine--tRNA ligase, chloroplastic/mitochondrial 2-like [Morus notabilis]XP_024030334.1 glycine--tRNA ligase, chloroplastic/mitochondrial 2-like [Morus notabilis]
MSHGASVLRPRPSQLSFFHSNRFHRHPDATLRHQFARASVSSICTSATPQHSSKDSNPERQKPSVLTFQQAIQRLQVDAGTMNHLIYLRFLCPKLWNADFICVASDILDVCANLCPAFLRI